MTTQAAAFRSAPVTRIESARTELTITMLGGFAISFGAVDVDQSQWRRRQAAALVKVLALTRGRAMHREQLMNVLWPDLAIGEAAPRLHKAAHFARRILRDPESLVLAGDLVALFPGRTVQVDAADFEALAHSAVAAADRTAAQWAVAEYHGPLLPQDRYETWALDARDRLHLLYVKVLRLSRQWDLLTDVDPTDEQAHLALITEMRQRGDHRLALRQFERLERALQTELGVAPSPHAVRLRAEIAREASSPVPTRATRRPVADRARSRMSQTPREQEGRVRFLAEPVRAEKTATIGLLGRFPTQRGLGTSSGEPLFGAATGRRSDHRP